MGDWFNLCGSHCTVYITFQHQILPYLWVTSFSYIHQISYMYLELFYWLRPICMYMYTVCVISITWTGSISTSIRCSLVVAITNADISTCVHCVTVQWTISTWFISSCVFVSSNTTSYNLGGRGEMLMHRLLCFTLILVVISYLCRHHSPLRIQNCTHNWNLSSTSHHLHTFQLAFQIMTVNYLSKYHSLH